MGLPYLYGIQRALGTTAASFPNKFAKLEETGDPGDHFGDHVHYSLYPKRAPFSILPVLAAHRANSSACRFSLMSNEHDGLTCRSISLDEVYSRFSPRTVFQSREWLNFLAESQRATPIGLLLLDRGLPVGAFVGAIIHRFGLRILGSPFPGWTTPYMGFLGEPSFAGARAVGAVAKFAFCELRCVHFEVADDRFDPAELKRAGYELRAYETFSSSLQAREEALFASMDSACRRCIRKADKAGVRIGEGDPSGFADEYYDQLEDVFAKQGLRPTYNRARVHSLVETLYPTGNLLLLRARSPSGECIATGIYPGLGHSAQFWGNASWRSHQHFRPNEALHWHAMRYWKGRGVQLFDWGGGGNYKLKYGVQPYSVPHVVLSVHPIITAMRDGAKRIHAVTNSLSQLFAKKRTTSNPVEE